MNDVQINSEPIDLFRLLKFASIVDSGGEAKIVIDEGLVTVNGEIATQKRKKIFAGDIIEFEGDEFRVIVGG